MNIFFLAREYINWLYHSTTRHGVHSPFVYRFIDECLYKKTDTTALKEILEQRKKLLKDCRILEYNDPGAGGKTKTEKDIKIREVSVRILARNSLQEKRFILLFYRMIQFFNYQTILELGTSLGLTAACMGKANPAIHIDTIEGAKPVAAIAKNFFQNAGMNNILLHEGNFDAILTDVIQNTEYDLIYIDGNHREEKLLHYFHTLTEHISPKGVMIIDDIRWSASMLKAWQNIKKHKKSRVTIDLFKLGLIFFDDRLNKENFLIRF
ncbi:MAG: O-methyltransferase [Bacteroidales bacterium]